MVNEVNKIIKNTLICRGALTLPNVGTLRIVRKSAQVVGKGVSAPEYTITFSSNEDAQSLIDAIASVATISFADAEDIYLRWLDKVRYDGRVVIEGIGSICDKSFKADDDIMSKLNPNRGSIITPTKRKRFSIGCLAIIVIKLIITTLFLYLCFTGYFTSDNNEENGIATESIEVSDNSAVMSNDASCEVVDVIDNPQVADDIIAVNQELVDDVVIEEVSTTKSVVVGPWYEAEDIQHYVIIGSYKRRGNANGVVAEVESNEDVVVDCLVIERGNMYSVAIYGSCDVVACESFVKEYKGLFPQAWIYSVE